jgi:uncharacterized protein YndB with AHSA1/START domain
MGRVKVEMEFEMRSSPAILYTHISTPSGLADWFADDVDVKGSKTYLFKWDGSVDEAELVKKTNNKGVKFRWVDGPEDEYFQMEIDIDDLTSDVTLLVTDFAEEEDAEETEMLWESQIDELRSFIGA